MTLDGNQISNQPCMQSAKGCIKRTGFCGEHGPKRLVYLGPLRCRVCVEVCVSASAYFNTSIRQNVQERPTLAIALSQAIQRISLLQVRWVGEV